MKDAYRIELTEEHLKGKRLNVSDCIGARALRDSIGKDGDTMEIRWFTNSGYVIVDHEAFIYNAITSNWKGINMMWLTEKDIGTTIYFRRQKQI